MRYAAAAASVLALLAVPAAASATPWHGNDVVYGPRHVATTTSGGVTPLITAVSHTLFLDDCLPAGCDVSPGFDDARTNRSSIPQQQSHLDGYSWGTVHWNQLVQCVRDTFAPFDIDVVTTDPGTTSHFEVAVGGFDYQLQMDGALGVAPFVPCDGALEDNVMTFVFANMTNDIDQLCWAVAQEASHAWGLDHELEARDPMTYLSPPFHKEFQDVDAQCGEWAGQPRTCWCGQDTQNSYRYLMDTFGPANPVPPTAAILAPADGAWVKPGFRVRATFDSQMSVTSLGLTIDGAPAGSAAEREHVFQTPTTLAAGDRQVEVRGTDAGARTASAAITVHVTGRCDASCADGFACLGGFCLPGPDVVGGLGAACADDALCVTGECWSDGSTTLCSQVCDDGRACPDGFECLGSGDGACWPAPAGAGTCAAATGTGAAPVLAVLALLVLFRRRRAV